MKILFFALACVVLVSCKKDKAETPTTLKIDVLPFYSNEKLILDNVYTTSENFKIKFQEIKFYFTDIKNDSKSLTDVAFFNYRDLQNSFISTEGNPSDFQKLQAVLGIDSVRNHADPSKFSSNNPLNSMIANDMHWDWNPGYIFVKIEAKMDTIPDSEDKFDHFISYHVGKDSYKVAMNFDQIKWTSIGTKKYQSKLILDMDKFLKGPNQINFKKENVTHSSPDKESLSLRIIDNFSKALYFEK